MKYLGYILLATVLFVPIIADAQPEETVFFDEFSNNNNRWYVGDHSNAPGEIKNGMYYFSNKKKETVWWRYNDQIPHRIDATRDFIIEASISQVEGTNDWGIGLMCFVGAKNEKMYGFWTLSDGQWVTTKGDQTLQNWTKNEVIHKGNNVLNNYKLVKRGGSLAYLINDQEVFSQPFSDDSIARVGFQIGSIKKIAIDYLRIAYLPPPDKTAPEIIFTSPAVTRGLKITQNFASINLTGRASDPSGISLLQVNGNEVVVDRQGNFTANISLHSGNNEIAVVARDGKMNEGAFRFTIFRQPEEIPPVMPIMPVDNIGKYYALIIGIQDYLDESITDLDRPVADAASLYTTLLGSYTFEQETVTFLKNPKRSEIFKALETLSRKIDQNDNLLIFYAGHGYWDEGRRQGYWFPSDAGRTDRSSWLTNADIKEYISAIKSKHTLLITDACFAGSIFKSRAVMMGASRAVKELYDLPSRKAMTSGTLKEVPDQSVFIEYMVKRLSQNTEQFLSAEQLFSSFRTAVINNSSNGQVPQFGEIKEAGDEGGDFIFIKK